MSREPAAASVAVAAPGPMTAAEVNEMFRGYGDAGGHWTGGDSTVSAVLPDGRVAWLFSDTFLGSVEPDGSRSRGTPMVNNTLVVQDGAALVETRHGGNADWPASLVQPEQPGEFFWVADAVVESNALKVLYNRYAKYGAGSLDVELKGTSLVTFALPDLTVGSVVDLPVGSAVTWGSALLADGDHTYVYGSSAAPGGLRFAHVARAPSGDLGGAWQFWTGSGWSADEGAAGRLLSGAGTAYAVQRVGAEYVLVTQETNQVFDPQFVAYTSASPTGPFTGPTYLLTAPEQQPGNNRIVYAARLHPELAPSGKLLMSYDVNSLKEDDVYADARLYRPRFVEIDWPRPAPGPVPAAPGGFAATTDNAGVVHLRWDGVSGVTGYRVWRRDLTAGQTYFARQSQPVTGTTLDVTGLITGHRYEFKVTAANNAGEGPFTTTVAVTSRIVRDASVIRLANTPEAVPGSYLVAFKDTPQVRGAGVETFARQVVAQAGGTLGPILDLALNGFGATLTEAQAIDLAGHPDVLDVEQNQTIVIDDGQEVPSTRHVDPNPRSWGLKRISQRDLPLGTEYRFPNAGDGVRVYVLDTGLRIDHSMFGGRAVYGRNTTDGSMNSPDCGNGHGTHVAGTIGGNGYGVARSVRLIGVKVFRCRANDGVAVANGLSIMDGVNWAMKDNVAKQGRAVINMSLAGPRSAIQMTYLDRAVGNAVARGITVVAAAGNITPESPDPDSCQFSPAHLAAVITVGNAELATVNGKEVDRRAGNSKVGACVDLFAPGTAIPSAGISGPDAIRTTSGTSMAAPHVAGVAAMILNAHPTLTPAQVEQIIIEASIKDRIDGLDANTKNKLLYLEEKPPALAPTNLAATANADGTVGLSWSPVPGEGVHYVLWQRDITANEDVLNRWATPIFGATTAIARNLEPGHTYEFKVAAANMAGIGPQSDAATATTRTNAPPAPENLTATANANGTITLRWQEPAPGLWYWVYQRDMREEEDDFTQLKLPITACCTMTAGLLKHDHQYEYKVSAVNAAGVEGPMSNGASAIADFPAPAPPSRLIATAQNGEVKLEWTASPSPNVWYWVYQRNISAREVSSTRLSIPITTCCSMTAGYLANNDEYEFYVTAVGGGPESARSSPVRATPRKPLPGQVTGVTATANDDGTVRLSWIEPPQHGPFYFEVYQRDVGTNGAWVKVELPLECCVFTAGLLEHNHTYDFKVVATNGLPGPESVPVRVTARHTLPPAPRDLRGRTAGDGTIHLTWTPPRAGGLYYWAYYRDVTAGQTTFTKAGLPTDKTSISIGPLVHNHQYELKVSAANAAGEGPASTTVLVVSQGGLPAPPANLSAVAGDGKVTLTWTRSQTPSVWYWIEWRAAGGPWQESKLDTSCCTYVISFLTNGTTYEFRVRATNASGDSGPTGSLTARPMPPHPLPPRNLTASAGDGVVHLAWAASDTPNVYYWLEYRSSDGGWRRNALPITNCCAYTASQLFNGTSYGFRLVATNLSGDSAPSNEAWARPLPALPRAPGNLRAYAGTSHVTLKWDPSPGPVFYWIEYKRANGPWQRLAYPFSGCCAFEVRPLDNFVSYQFRVKATNLAGDSPASNVATATPSPPVGSCWLAALPPAGSPPGWVRIWVPRASYSCTAMMYNLSITLYLWTNYYSVWVRDGVSTRLRWSEVDTVKSGSIDAWVVVPEGGCFQHYSQVVAEWTDVYGNRQRRSESSRKVWLDDSAGPC